MQGDRDLVQPKINKMIDFFFSYEMIKKKFLKLKAMSALPCGSTVVL